MRVALPWQDIVPRLSRDRNALGVLVAHMSRVLIVEDDLDICSVLEFNLQTSGFQTEVAHKGATAIMRESPAELVLLDLMLPDISGIDVCRQLRAEATTQSIPIVILTARGQESDRLAGHESGADDYIVKPFSVRELILRIQAVLRRSKAPEAYPHTRFEGSGIVLDEEAHRVYVHGVETALTNTEYKLLLMFLRRPGRVFSRQQLLDQVWNMPSSLVTRTVDTHVKRLREKLGDAGAAIETVRSVGYRFVESPASAP